MRLTWMITLANAPVLGEFFAQSAGAKQKNSQTGGKNDRCRLTALSARFGRHSLFAAGSDHSSKRGLVLKPTDLTGRAV